MKSLKQEYIISGSLNDVWDALVNPKTIDNWGGGPAKMTDKIYFEFSLWGGDIFGKNKEVITNKKLVQEWYGGKWKEPSIVTFLLSNDNSKTKVLLIHENIPDEEFNDIKSGWKDYYMNPLKEFVENNVS